MRNRHMFESPTRLPQSPGNCYLFACGPPEDFRCKFTAHGNFSSGVLALSRRLAELQDVERLQRQDHSRDRDLGDLRYAVDRLALCARGCRGSRSEPRFHRTVTKLHGLIFCFACFSRSKKIELFALFLHFLRLGIAHLFGMLYQNKSAVARSLVFALLSGHRLRTLHWPAECSLTQQLIRLDSPAFAQRSKTIAASGVRPEPTAIAKIT
ncbi:hypothetical protein EVAR_79812_1 [Eumeta japonica]|uniref:Uncharacterized protein n=1 Tax=Eumeta variegata TaxID=151549 RepID=A0A4C1WTX5_EUMVA|nr:hypothetical protein EVAR_79812_1 [Eumeta japonica]